MTPPEAAHGAADALHTAGAAVNSLDLSSETAIRRAIPIAAAAAAPADGAAAEADGAAARSSAEAETVDARADRIMGFSVLRSEARREAAPLVDLF